MTNDELVKYLLGNYENLIILQSSVGNRVAEQLSAYARQAREAWETAALLVKTMALWEKTRCPHTIECAVHKDSFGVPGKCTCSATAAMEKAETGLCRNKEHQGYIHIYNYKCVGWTAFDPETILPKEY